MLTKCTHPAAPFYETDLLILSMWEALGVDLPCNLLASATIAALGAPLVLGCIGVGLIMEGRRRRR